MDIGVLWLAGEERLVGKVGDDEGDGLALRKDGDEILFAPYESKPMRWVSVGEFVVLAEPGEVDDQNQPEVIPSGDVGIPDSPFPRRRRE